MLAQSVDGTTGIEAVLRHRPDWVLLDVNLPDQDGLSVARELRTQASPSSIILTSAGECPWSETELAEAGVHTFIAKDRLFAPDLLDLILQSLR